MLLNENIKKLRVARGINQVEFGRALGVSKQCVSNWENDNVMPSIEMLCKIADYFLVSTDFLLGRKEERSIELAGLTNEQIAHISLIINDLAKKNE